TRRKKWAQKQRRRRSRRCSQDLNPLKSPPGQGALLKNHGINKCINSLQNGIFLLFLASKLIEFCVVGVGGFCMGHGYFVLPKWGCDRNGGGLWSLIDSIIKRPWLIKFNLETLIHESGG